MRALLTALAMFLLAANPAAADDAGFDALLDRYLIAGRDGINRVDYAAWRGNGADRAGLDAYVAELSTQRPSAFARDRAFAYWANLYNAVTLQIVLERYPVRSIMDIRSQGVGFDPRPGPWRTKRVVIEGRRLSLDAIEHQILRAEFHDPRVHYAVNCASLACPNLQPRAWRADTLDADLDQAARAYVNHPRGVAIRADGALRVSSLYRWFRADFGGSDAGVVAHLRAYAGPALAARIGASARIGGHGYDWALNDAAARP